MCSAKRRNCPVVRPRSPFSRASGRPVSWVPISVMASARFSISSAIALRKAARSCLDVAAYSSKHASAASQARATCSGVPTLKWWAGPCAGSDAKVVSPVTHSPAIRCLPWGVKDISPLHLVLISAAMLFAPGGIFRAALLARRRVEPDDRCTGLYLFEDEILEALHAGAFLSDLVSKMGGYDHHTVTVSYHHIARENRRGTTREDRKSTR